MTYSRLPRSTGCDTAYAALIRLLDGAYSTTDEAEALRREVAQCPECWESLGLEEEVRGLLRSCCGVSAPTRLRETIVLKMHVEWTIG